MTIQIPKKTKPIFPMKTIWDIEEIKDMAYILGLKK